MTKLVRKRYWSWGAIVAFGVFLIVEAAVIGGFGYAMLHGRRGLELAVIAAFIVTAAIFTFVLIRFRDRYDYFIDTDGHDWISRWTPAGEIVIRKQDVVNVSDDARRVVIEGTSGTIVVTRACTGFARLRALAAGWRQSKT